MGRGSPEGVCLKTFHFEKHASMSTEMCVSAEFKGTVHPQNQHFSLTFSVITQSKLFWCELPQFWRYQP